MLLYCYTGHGTDVMSSLSKRGKERYCVYEHINRHVHKDLDK